MPRNATEALACANRQERAQQILADGYTFRKDTEYDIVAVVKPGQVIASYWIKDGKCTCKDSQKGFDCKHYLAWNIVQEAQEELYSEDMAAMETLRHYEEERAELLEVYTPALLPAPYCAPPIVLDPRALSVLSALRRNIAHALLGAQDRNWPGREKELNDGLAIVDEFIGRYHAGEFTL